tara:strand:+ start:371 stop:544 length:174 start_codon:yes stop_codon:yes gene_type:complete
MYKLKKEYIGCTVSTGGYAINLDNVKSEQVESLSLEDYFDKKKEKKSKPTDKIEKTL